MTSQPAERCGDMTESITGTGWYECVLRPGHHGSHADHGDMRWAEIPRRRPDAEADLDAAQRRAALFQARLDAARAWARQHLTPEQQTGLLAALRGDQPPTA